MWGYHPCDLLSVSPGDFFSKHLVADMTGMPCRLPKSGSGATWCSDWLTAQILLCRVAWISFCWFPQKTKHLRKFWSRSKSCSLNPCHSWLLADHERLANLLGWSLSISTAEEYIYSWKAVLPPPQEESLWTVSIFSDLKFLGILNRKAA